MSYYGRLYYVRLFQRINIICWLNFITEGQNNLLFTDIPQTLAKKYLYPYNVVFTIGEKTAHKKEMLVESPQK